MDHGETGLANGERKKERERGERTNRVNTCKDCLFGVREKGGTSNSTRRGHRTNRSIMEWTGRETGCTERRDCSCQDVNAKRNEKLNRSVLMSWIPESTLGLGCRKWKVCLVVMSHVAVCGTSSWGGEVGAKKKKHETNGGAVCRVRISCLVAVQSGVTLGRHVFLCRYVISW